MSGPVDTVDAMTSPAIEAIDLVKKFGDNTAVDGVS
ncbi:MAG: daunorubicin ABC transporter ATP-binding protein, partial [Mycobacterium sp.]